MKAEELMITTSDVMVGDWVRITIEGEQYPAVVNSIKLNTEEIDVSFLAAPGDWEDGDGYDEIEPIPLTAEILEANGFEKNSAKYYRIVIGKQMAGDGYETQEVAISEKGLLLIFTSVCDVRIPIKYVHELQHALRLCGIDKEIVLNPET